MSSDKPVELTGLAEGEWFGAEDDTGLWMTGVEHQRSANRRAQDREHAHIEVMVDPGGSQCTISDISIGGVLIYTEHPLPFDTRVKLLLQTGHGVVRAEGVVRWTAKGTMRDLYTNRLGMGVQFLWVEIGLREVLEQTLQAPLPAL